MLIESPGMADSPWERLSRPAHGRRANSQCFPTLLLSEITTISVSFEARWLVERNATAQFGDELQKLEERLANKTRELEIGFDQGFESLRRLRDQ